MKEYKKINWKLLDSAFWLEVILSYFLPFRISGTSQYQIGFPLPFISVYTAEFRISPFLSMHVNPINLLLNGMILYLAILFFVKMYQKVRYQKSNFPPT